MKKIRIGNDIHITWSLFTNDGIPLILEEKDVTLYLKDPFSKQGVLGYTINENVIEWTFLGKDQKVIGAYSLILVINEDNKDMATTDVCNFVELVAHSCEAGGSSDAGVQVESIELTSIVEIGGGQGGGSYDDTEVKNELARLEKDKADKTELTELSLEVSGLSERVDELGEGGSSVFEAEYNVTPYVDIVEAYKKNKHCICRYNNMFLSLAKLNYEGNDTVEFSAFVNDTQYIVYCFNNNKWSNTFIKVEKVANKVTSINQSSNNNEYPSAKAVYDFVQTTLGTLINGDY